MGSNEIYEIGREGNTKPLASRNQLKKWFFTYNNFNEPIIDIMEIYFKEICEKYLFQEEIGSQGTKHLQGAIWLKKRMRWSEFKLPNNIHWEKTKGKDEDVINYCSKDETSTGRRWMYNIKINPKLKIIENLFPWQIELSNILLKEPDDRAIIWIVDPQGGNGKSQLVKKLVHERKYALITGGKKSDIINLVYNYVVIGGNYLECLLMDIPRDVDKVSYGAIEELKNGIIVNTKFETGSVIINSPHVVIFANTYPDKSKFTLDRWHIYEIQDRTLKLI